MKAKITKRTVDAARPGKSDLFIWDEDVTGFGLKVTPKGKKFYLLEYRMGVRQRRYTIGRHGAPLTPDVARELAIKVRHFIAKNCNPAIVKARFGQDHMRRRLIKRLARTHVGSAVGRALTAPFFRAFSLTVGRCGRYRDGVIEILPAVREGAVSKVAPPRVQGAPLKVSETPIPPNVPFRFRNAAVLGEVSVVGTDKGAFLPDSDFRSPDRLFTTPKSYYVHTKFGDGIVSRFLWGRVIDKG